MLNVFKSTRNYSLKSFAYRLDLYLLTTKSKVYE